MLRRMAPGVAAIAAFVAVAAGCGGSSNSSPPPTSPSPGTPALALAVRSALAQRLSAGQQLPGETARGAEKFQTGAAFAAGDPDSTEGQRFRTEGLEAVGSEHPKIHGTNDAIRSVLVFGTAAGAQRDAHATSGVSAAETVRFAVPGVPGAVGTELGEQGHPGARNVIFAVGQYEYVLGVALKTNAANAPSRKQLATGAASWYGQVKSLP